jgi:hypothetical protein
MGLGYVTPGVDGAKPTATVTQSTKQVSRRHEQKNVNFHLGGLGNFASRTSDSAADIPKKKILEGP